MPLEKIPLDALGSCIKWFDDSGGGGDDNDDDGWKFVWSCMMNKRIKKNQMKLASGDLLKLQSNQFKAANFKPATPY